MERVSSLPESLSLFRVCSISGMVMGMVDSPVIGRRFYPTVVVPLLRRGFVGRRVAACIREDADSDDRISTE